MKISNAEAENLTNYYFEKAVTMVVGVPAIGFTICFALYKINSFLTSLS
jgi:adenine/guanine phosphoribosyltransferase-like PRPP-binding protein